MKIFTFPLLSLLFSIFHLIAQGSGKAIVGGTLVNTDGQAPIENAVILIQEDRIIAAGAAGEIQVPPGAEIINAQGKWIIPGLIDAHVHFFQSGGLYTRPDAIDLRKHVPYADGELVQIRDRLHDTFARYLRCGITAVMDVGGPYWNFEVRALAETSEIAPTVAVAGPLISTYQPDALTTDDPPIIKVKSAYQARKMVRTQAAWKPDLIKIWYIVGRGETAEDNYPIVEAAIKESHKLGLRVAVHATELETARLAVQAGADVLVHSVTDKEVDQAFIELLVDNQVIYTPTFVVFEGYPETFRQQGQFLPVEFELGNPYIMGTLFDLRHLPPADIPERVLKAMAQATPVEPNPIALANLKKLHAAGVPIAVGTDAGNIGTLHGPSIFREFELFALAGLSPAEILEAATINGARLMGREQDYGTIEPGKMADLVILNADPLTTIMNTSNIQAVVKHGRYYTTEQIIQPSAEDIVQRQLNAYNAHDIDAFMSTYAPDIEIYAHPDSLLMSDWEGMKALYGGLFTKAPTLHAKIVNRITAGKYVIDREHVTGLEKDKDINAVAIYEVQDGLIRRVWFIRE